MGVASRHRFSLRRKFIKAVVLGWHLFVVVTAIFIWIWHRDLLHPHLSASVFGVVTFLVGVEAFVLQLWSSEQGHAQMTEIARSVTTRYVGPFPDYLADVLDLARGARRRLWIMADCVDHGSFSDPVLFKSVRREIEDAAQNRDVSVQILVCGEPAPISRSSPWWGYTFEEALTKGGFKECLDFYCKYNHKKPEELPNDDATYRKMLLDDYEKVEKGFRTAGADIRPAAQPGPKAGAHQNDKEPGLFFWLQDDKEAVFILAHTGPNSQGLAFRTRDSSLIKIIESTFQRNDPGASAKAGSASPAAV